MKRILSLLTAMVLTVTLTACRRTETPKKEPTGATMQVELKDSYVSKTLLDGRAFNLNMFSVRLGDWLVLSEYRDNAQHASLYSITDDTLTALNTAGSPIGGTQTEDGYRLFFSNVRFEDLKTGGGTYTIVDYDSSFQEIRSQDVTAAYPDIEEDDRQLLLWYGLSNGGQILLDGSRHLHYYDADGVYQGMITGSISGICSIYERNDKIYVICAAGSYWLGEIHLDTCSAELLEIPGMPDWCTGMAPGEGDYDVYFQDEEYLYGADIADGKIVPLVNFTDSDLSGQFEYMIALPDETFLLIEQSGSTCTLLHSRRRTQEEIDALQIVTIGTFQTSDAYMQEMIRRWNRQSDSIHIVVKSYLGNSYESVEEYNEALSAFSGFKADLINGVVPDIICMNGIDYQMLSDKGMLEDLRPWMEKDPDFHEDEYFMNLFESLSYKGALERMTFSYRANCFMAKSEFAGTEPVQTIEAFNALADTLPEGMSMFPTWWSKKDLFYSLVDEQLDSFVDYEKGTCCFDTDAFIRLLTLCDQGTADNTSISDDYAWKNNKVLLKRLDFWTVDSYHTAAAVDFNGEPTVLIGKPQANSKGNGGVFQTQSTFAVYAESFYKAEIWEFIKFALNETNQCQVGDIYLHGSFGFPVNRNALHTQFQEAINTDPSTLQSGRGIPTAEEEQIVTSFIEGITMTSCWNETLNNIASEEAAVFFAGDCTAEQAARSIQGRVTLYLAEKS